MGVRACLFLTVTLLSCNSVTQPTRSVEAASPIEAEAATKFGFEMRLPSDLEDSGWRTYSWEPTRELIDSYRTVHFRRLLTLVVEEIDTLGITGLVSTERGYEVQAGAGSPRIVLHVFEDLPEFSFSSLADTIRSVSHEVVDWELNGVHVKELIPQTADGNWNLRGYPHASTHVPRLIAREHGFLFCFNYWVGDDIGDIEWIVSTFQVN